MEQVGRRSDEEDARILFDGITVGHQQAELLKMTGMVAAAAGVKLGTPQVWAEEQTQSAPARPKNEH